MRPVRLEVEGFTAFRDRAVVDFDGVDLFALCGPTGSGKTSVIDAVTFALYGSVPRLDDRAVAPIVSQGRNEAKVRLDFTVDGEAYAVVRVVRGTTKEARLVRQADGEVLADGARHLTPAVEDLLGLDYKQFTTCVSLPQGEFARFLHAEPRHRQDLLVKLLGWGVYDSVRASASQRAAEAEQRAKIAEGQLADLTAADEAAEVAAVQRIAELSGLAARVEAAKPALDALARAAEEAAAKAAEASRAMGLLAGVAVPDGIDSLAATVVDAVALRDRSRVEEEEAAATLTAAEAAVVALPARAALEAAIADHAERARLLERVATGEQALNDALAAETQALDAVAAAEDGVASAEAAWHAARTASLAHTLAADLVVGEACPVCRSTVTEAPHAPPADVAAAEQARRRATERLTQVRTDAGGRSEHRAKVEAKLAQLREQVDAVGARLADAPSPHEATAALERVTAAEAAVAEARRGTAEAAAARRQADEAAELAARAETEARRAFDGARDLVAALGPPAPARADIAADWAELGAWAAAQRPVRQAEADEHRSAADAATAELADKRAELAELARGAGVELDGVAIALARAEAALERVRADRARAERLRTELAAAADAQAVAKAVADHLAANRFERWLLDEALQQLVVGATARLRELSGGAYSLCLDEKSRAFAVVDHINAGHIRSARTLSGGETFLTSLALALALADQVAAMAAGSAARLETVFLDEGFGTLDPESLDVVAGALEELGAGGRMVGIVTHVQELAERLPVRYQVRKVAGAASVERVDA